ncbi:hypothetical protein QYE76_009259 [Lolium multiflorum]|uniref:Retrotransposon Copia-like N-terminal domain-containing protein n=1 Tax=Lolium multiflorum TaxID=4521 RepID=A0AAD8TUX2_LOLMU|nr:hypothetical protein QYE76_009259 [Lolium multiflorum]
MALQPSSSLALTTSSSASLPTAVAGPIVTPPSDTAAVPVLPAIAIRLNGSNFMLWKALAVPNLAGARLHGFLDGSAPAPPRTIREGTGDAARDVPNPAYAQWWTLDQRVLGHLLGSMHEEVSAQLIGCTTAEAAWTVHAMFSAENRAGIRALRREIQGLKKGDKSASEYMQKVKALADAMAAAGSPLRDDEIIDYMLTGLGTAFNPIAASMDFATTPVTLAMFYKTVLNYEGLQKQQQADPEEWTSSANAASRPYFNNSGRAGDSSRPSGGRPAGGGSQGQHGPVQGGNGQGSGGHGGGGQDRRRNDGNGGNSGRNGGGRRRWRPQCQICDIWGHDASDCRRRYDPKQRTGNSASTSSTEQYWHLDSGASDHLTSDLERLHVHDRYHGKDQVQVANGAVCNTFISEDQDLARQFDAISPKDASFSFPKKLKEIVDKNKKPSPDRLRLLKLTCKMVITMMKHRGTYVKEDLDTLMDALSSASKEMFILDGSMIFDFRHDETTTLKPCRSLASLVKEARELVERHDRLLSSDLSLWSPV